MIWLTDPGRKEHALKLLGLAYRAGKVIIGEDAVMRTLQMKLAKVVFVAGNASANTIDRFSRKCFFYKTKYCNELTDEEMSSALGKPLCRILAVTDQGFADALMRDLYGGAGNEG